MTREVKIKFIRKRRAFRRAGFGWWSSTHNFIFPFIPLKLLTLVFIQSPRKVAQKNLQVFLEFYLSLARVHAARPAMPLQDKVVQNQKPNEVAFLFWQASDGLNPNPNGGNGCEHRLRQPLPFAQAADLLPDYIAGIFRHVRITEPKNYGKTGSQRFGIPNLDFACLCPRF
jgi:hypothetical protein